MPNPVSLRCEIVRKFAVCLVASQTIGGYIIGGVENFVVQLSSWLDGKSIKTVVICGSPKRITQIFKVVRAPQLSKSPPSRNENAQPGYLPPLVGSFMFSAVAFLKVISLQKKYGFSVIHAQDTSYAALAAVLSAKLLGLPVVLHSHGIELRSAMVMLQSKGLNKSVVAPVYLSFFLLLERELVKRCDSIIVVSQEAKDYLVNLGISTGNCSVINAGVDSKKFCQNSPPSIMFQSKRNGKKSNIIIGFVGRLFFVKNLERLIEAFAIAQRSIEGAAKLIIIGDGPMRQRLEEKVEALGIKAKVTFLGVRSDIPNLLRQIDVFILPSLIEGSPISLMEAMTAGKAVIASDIPSIREIVRNGKEGILVNPYDTEDMKRAILFFYNNPDLIVTMGYNAEKRAKLYGVEMVYGKILQLYEEVIVCKTCCKSFESPHLIRPKEDCTFSN